MKPFLNIILFSFLSLGLSNAILAQQAVPKVETATFKVVGVCKMCKERIENAALIKGVKFAEWEKETQILTVIYKTKQTNPEAIQKAVAEHGHDTETITATDEAYQKLPACCAYRDGVEVH